MVQKCNEECFKILKTYEQKKFGVINDLIKLEFPKLSEPEICTRFRNEDIWFAWLSPIYSIASDKTLFHLLKQGSITVITLSREFTETRFIYRNKKDFVYMLIDIGFATP